MKAVTREKSLKRFLLAQKNVVYTDPIEVQAGKIVTVLYNPSNTVLSGKLEVWFRFSFNHWTHPSGPFPPQKMEHAGNGTHLQTTGEMILCCFQSCPYIFIGYYNSFFFFNLVSFGTSNLLKCFVSLVPDVRFILEKLHSFK